MLILLISSLGFFFLSEHFQCPLSDFFVTKELFVHGGFSLTLCLFVSIHMIVLLLF